MSTLPANGVGQEFLIDSCPHYLINIAPAVIEALQAHRWWETGQLGLKYPNGLPLTMIGAIDAITNGFARADRDRFDEQQRKRK